MPVAGAALPSTVLEEGTFDELGAISVIEADLDECDFDLYNSIHTAPDNYADLEDVESATPAVDRPARNDDERLSTEPGGKRDH